MLNVNFNSGLVQGGDKFPGVDDHFYDMASALEAIAEGYSTGLEAWEDLASLSRAIKAGASRRQRKNWRTLRNRLCRTADGRAVSFAVWGKF